MTTTEAMTKRIQANTSKNGRVGLDPLTILALVQALIQVVQACYPQPEDALAFLRCEDLENKPLRRLVRRRLISAYIGRNYNGPGMRLAEVREAVWQEIDGLTVDIVADCFADLKSR